MRVLIIALIMICGCRSVDGPKQFVYNVVSLDNPHSINILYVFAEEVQQVTFTSWDQFNIFTDQYMYNLTPFKTDEEIERINQGYQFIRAFAEYGANNGYYPNHMIRHYLRQQIDQATICE